MHAANGVMDVELAYRADGKVLGLRVRDIADEGKNWSARPAQLIKLGNIANGYRSDPLRAASVLTNKCPSGANRGIGKPSCHDRAEPWHCWPGAWAGPCRNPPANYVQPQEMPYTTPSGRSLRQRRLSGHAHHGADPLRLRRAGRADARPRGGAPAGDRAGDLGGAGRHQSSVLRAGDRPSRCSPARPKPRWSAWSPSRTVRAAIGNPASGQGYETVNAQIIADGRVAAPTRVQVERGFDSATTPWPSSTTRTSSP